MQGFVRVVCAVWLAGLSACPGMAQTDTTRPADPFRAPWDTVPRRRTVLDSLYQEDRVPMGQDSTQYRDSLRRDSLVRVPRADSNMVRTTGPVLVVPTGLPKVVRRAVRSGYQPVQAGFLLAAADSAVRQRLHLLGYPDAQLRAVWQPDTLRPLVLPGLWFGYDSLHVLGLPNREGFRLLRTRWVSGLRSPFAFADLQRRLQSVLQEYENEGHPFAAFQGTDVQYRPYGTDTVGVVVRTQFEAGPLVIIDSVRVEGDGLREKPRFVANLVRIQPGDAYNQRALQAVPRLLNNSLYYQNVRPPRVEFTGNRAVVVLQMERRRANRFDALLGLLPPRQGETRLQFTGLLDFQLVSAFRWGEVMAFKYERLLGQTQVLNVSYLHPYLFGLPVKVQAKFSLFRNDTLFLTQSFEPGVYYQFGQALQLRAWLRVDNSSLLSTEPYRVTRWPPPPVLNARTQSYGLGLVLNTVDYAPNPSRGIVLETDAALGTKRIRSLAGLDSLDRTQLLLRQPRTEATVWVQGFIPTARRQVLLLANRSFWLSQEQYFDSDQRFIGGARVLRGFNENEFLASLYSLLTVEYRLRLNLDTYIGAFVDAAYLETRRNQQVQVQRPLGTGLTLALRTGAGIVSVAYALGTVGDVPLQPTRGRIHLGLVNAF